MTKHLLAFQSFYEFFAGSGMVRAGLGDSWSCLFANDLDEKKAASYKRNWGNGDVTVRDVGKLSSEELPGSPNLAWASFPCQDLSLAGMGAGLKGHRSGTFWPFWNLIRDLHREGRLPELVVLENVCGALTSHDGADFRSLIKALRVEGYRPGAMVIDASLFLPQSRPRLFIVGVRSEMKIDPSLISVGPVAPFHTAAVKTAHEALPKPDRDAWIWWNLPVPPRRVSTFSSIIEDGLDWHRPEVTKALLAMMSPINLAKITAAKKMGTKVVGAVYKRTRSDQDGIKAQRAEVRFDDIAGCLRTPGGGSSRQSIVVVQGNRVRSRLLSPREAARLMGLPDTYVLPKNYNEAYRLMGDGVAVPVVRHLAHYLLEPLLTKIEKSISEAA